MKGQAIQNTERWLSLEDYDREEWRPVVGYEGIYEVSSYGRVKRLPYEEHLAKNGIYPYTRSHKEKIMKGSVNTGIGYYVVSLTKDGECKHMLCHRLVAEAFIPNPENYPFINHKDEIPLNNMVENLEWCTPLYNTRYGGGIQRREEAKKKSRKGWKRVFKYSVYGEFIAAYDSMNDAARKDSVHSLQISSSCHGMNMRRNGAYYRFEEDGYIEGESLVDRANRLKLKDDDRDSVFQINRRIKGLPLSTKHYLTIDGKTMAVSAWAHLFGKSHVWLLKVFKEEGEGKAAQLVKEKLKERHMEIY